MGSLWGEAGGSDLLVREGANAKVWFLWELTARAVGVENTRDAHVDAILVVETICQRLGDTLPFIVACAWTDGVDVAPATR